MQLPPILTIAGSDSSGGAGVQADLKTITMLGGYGMSAITALTAQNTLGVAEILPIASSFLQAQLNAICTDIMPVAVKIGMVFDTPQILAIVEAIRAYKLHTIVVDPVMVATSGDPLLQRQAIRTMESQLFPLADLITPNLSEAETLSGRKITSELKMEEVAKALSEKYQVAVLLKGGHSVGDCNDLLCTEGQLIWVRGIRLATQNTHGTGCTLSAALATYLALGFDLAESVRRAKQYVTKAIEAGLELGHGHGPIAHNYQIEAERS